jgi:hypothetical protein
MAESVLSQRWSLDDVEDVEGLCGKVLDNRMRRFGATLKADDREDALAFLLAWVWALSLRFDPWHEATHRRSFSTFLYRRLEYAVVDWYRQRFRDSRYHDEEIVVLSLDYDADGELSELVESLSYGQEDPADGALDLRRVLAG